MNGVKVQKLLNSLILIFPITISDTSSCHHRVVVTKELCNNFSNKLNTLVENQ